MFLKVINTALPQEEPFEKTTNQYKYGTDILFEIQTFFHYSNSISAFPSDTNDINHNEIWCEVNLLHIETDTDDILDLGLGQKRSTMFLRGIEHYILGLIVQVQCYE